MDNIKDNKYYLNKITINLEFIIKHTEGLSLSEFESDEVLIDSILFRLIQISENSDKLTLKFKDEHSSFPWRSIKGMRNRIVHEYGNVDLTVVYNTIKEDIPYLLNLIKTID